MSDALLHLPALPARASLAELRQQVEVAHQLLRKFAATKAALAAEVATLEASIAAVEAAIITDHGGLSGLSDDDHTIYSKADGTRAFTGTVSGVTPTSTAHLATKGYVDGAIVTDHGGLSGLSDDDHSIYLFKSPTATSRNLLQPTADVVPLRIRKFAGASANILEVQNASGTVTGFKVETGATIALRYGSSVDEFSTDTLMGGDSNNAVPTEKATATYAKNDWRYTFETSIDRSLGANSSTVLVDTGSGDITLTLPAAASYTYKVYTIKKITSDANKVIIDGNGSETIDEATTVEITTQHEAVTVQSDGTEWWII